MRAGSLLAVVLTVAAVAGTGREVSAHRLDECLQAARIAVEPTAVSFELDLTPGTAVAQTVIADIDRDHDGSLSSVEQRAYVERVLAAIDLEMDGRALDVTPGTSTFPDVDALQRGEGTIRLRSVVALPRQSTGTHHVFFRNSYRGDVSVYLANALVPESDRVAVTAQHHDASQRELTIDYKVRDWQFAPTALWLLGGTSVVLAGLVLRPSKRA